MRVESAELSPAPSRPRRALPPNTPRVVEAPTPTPPPIAVEVPESARPIELEHFALPVAEPRLWPWIFAAAALVALLLVRQSLAGDAPSAVILDAPAVFSAPHPASPNALLPPARPDALDRAASVPAAEPIPSAARADARLKREGYSAIPGGVLYTPSTLHSADGAYDLLLHFHGNTRVVEESVRIAGLDAVVAIVNLGVGSAPYQDAYAVPTTYEELLASIDRTVASRGLAHPRLRRVALSAWSAGYGAVSTILEQRKGKEPLDAILLLDGLHAGFVGDDPATVNPLQLGMFKRAAERAAEGELLFSITHSQIDPRTYVSAAHAADFLLGAVGATRHADDLLSDAPPHLELLSAKGAVAKKLEKHMVPESEAQRGLFHVRGYRGETPEHHMAHLLQMGATVLPELASRWQTR